MKLLIYEWPSFLQHDLYSVLNDIGISYDTFTYNFEHDGFDKQYNEIFIDYFKSNYAPKEYDALFSISYWPVLSDAANELGVKYISWSYDCPIDTVDPFRTFNNSCNSIFLFDKIQYENYKKMGFETVHYMPLGVYESRYKKINPHGKSCIPFRTDISFVGSLYNGSTNGIKSLLSEKTASVIDQIVEMQKKLPNQYILDKLITDSFISAINSEIETINPGIIGNLSVSGTKNTIAYEVTGYNRMMLLLLLGKRYNTDLYTSTTIDHLGDVRIHNPINYLTEMPLCFAASKINLNSTFISIQSGLPLRVLDIMASGGFLLSNNQLEFSSMGYTDGEHVALFNSFEDAIEKAGYYLSHSDIRESIAKKGRIQTFSKNPLEKRLQDILAISFHH